MTISSTTRTAGPFTGTGTVSSFAFAFKVFSAGDIAVYRTQVSTGVVTTLVLNSDYTVALDPVAGGTVTLTGGNLASGTTLLIASSVANTQPVDITNQSGFYPAVINDALDRATVQVQQLQQQSNRGIRYPDTEIAISAVLPKAADRANQYLAFDSNGAVDIGGAVPDQRYYGSKTADPATRNDGSARQAGDLYFNSVSNVMKVFNGSAWDTVTTTPVDGDKGDITISGGGATYTIDNGAVTSAKLDTNIAVSGTLSVGSTASVTSDMTVGGNLTVTGNDIKSSGGTTAITLSGDDVAVADDLTVTAGDLTVTAGDLNVTAGNLNVTAGDLNVTAGDLTVTAGDIIITAGDLSVGGEATFGSVGQSLINKQFSDSPVSGASVSAAFPTWVRRVTVSFAAVSSSGTSYWALRVMRGGTPETANYTSRVLHHGVAWDNTTAAFYLTRVITAVNFYTGTYVLDRVDTAGTIWCLSGQMMDDGANTLFSANGYYAGGTTPITGIEVLPTVPPQVWDGGRIAISWE